LKKDHDFEWVEKLGTVFCVFDQQDSGNISFGVEKNGEKRFVKYAGANTIHASIDSNIAVQNLKQSVPLYQELKHPHLVNLLDHFETKQGYALIFKWFAGETLHNHWEFPPPEKYEHPDSPFYRFKQLSVKKRLKSFQQILEFHVHVEKKDYVAIDFYDGSILYDFSTDRTKICDIDLYRKKPFRNLMGRMWGSSRFMSPEEFQLNEYIDERTNVFNMGCTAFCLLGSDSNHSFEHWDAGRELYEIARKAVEKDRDKRYSSVEEFYTEWKKWSKG
jgi:serine/threonine protein kinase, bacterial